MAVDLATIGTLVTLVKNVIDSVKAMGFFQGNSKSKISGELAVMFTRVEVISAQIEKIGILIRMVPAWLAFADHMPMWKQASDFLLLMPKVSTEIYASLFVRPTMIPLLVLS